MRWCARAIVLLSLLSVASSELEYTSCKYAFKGGQDWTASIGDTYCYKRMPKQLMTKPDADKLCSKLPNLQATLPRFPEPEQRRRLKSLFAFYTLCPEGHEDRKTYWLGMHKRGHQWYWDGSSEPGVGGTPVTKKGSNPKYSVANQHFVYPDGSRPLGNLPVFEAKLAKERAYTCCQVKLNEAIKKAPPSTVRTTPHYIPTTRKDTPRKPVTTTTHKPVTTKPGGNLDPKGTEDGMSKTVLFIVIFLVAAMLVAALIGVGLWAHSKKKKKRRRHHHGRRHAESRSITAKTNPSTSIF